MVPAEPAVDGAAAVVEPATVLGDGLQPLPEHLTGSAPKASSSGHQAALPGGAVGTMVRQALLYLAGVDPAQLVWEASGLAPHVLNPLVGHLVRVCLEQGMQDPCSSSDDDDTPAGAAQVVIPGSSADTPDPVLSSASSIPVAPVSEPFMDFTVQEYYGDSDGHPSVVVAAVTQQPAAVVFGGPVSKKAAKGLGNGLKSNRRQLKGGLWAFSPLT